MTKKHGIVGNESTKRKLRKYLFVGSILAWPIINWFVFWFYVNIDGFFLSFKKASYTSGVLDEVWTFSNFGEVIASLTSDVGEVFIALKNTMLIFVTGQLIGYPLTIIMAYFVYKKIPLYKSFRLILYLPNIISAAAIVALFKYSIYSGGPYEAICLRRGVEYMNPLMKDGAIWVVILYNFIFGLGGGLVVLGGAMNAINPEVLEAGQIDGCTWFKELVYLILPMCWPTISTTLILGLAGFLSADGPILAMTKGENGTQTLSYLLMTYSTGVDGREQNIYYASALGLLMTCVAFPIVLITKRIFDKVQVD